jgi:AcrR family transcriptional regulator
VFAAARKSFAAHGPRRATIDQIARDAGVSRQAIYEQFTDKDTLFHQVVNDLEERAVNTITGAMLGNAELPLPDWIRHNYRALLAFVAEYPEALPLASEAEQQGNPVVSRLRHRVAEIFTRASTRRWTEYGVEVGRADLALTAMYFGMAESLIKLNWPGERPDQDSLADLLTDFTIGGLFRLYTQTPETIARLR